MLEMKLFSLVVVVTLLSIVCSVSGNDWTNIFTTNADPDPEIRMNTTQLITSKGYPCEDYDVVTDDGYIISIQRIPYGLKVPRPAPRPVVLLQHGFLSCSAVWVENLVNESLGFMMADAGYDVWLGNSRGNTYGRRHKTLTPHQKEFWDFSWDEMAQYDLPATVDKILNITREAELFYVGYSQGGATGYAQMSRDPKLNSQVKMFAALAPAVYMNHMTSPFRKMAPFSKEFSVLAKMLGVKEFMPSDALTRFLSEDVCNKEIPSTLCENILFVTCGYDEKQMNKTRLPVYAGQNPAGTSVNTVIHYAQMVKSKQFQMFDFGEKGNKIKYNQTTPPVYDVSRVTTPVAMFTGTNDWLVVASDATRLAQETKNLVSHKAISGWEHLDFVWAMNAPSACYNDVISAFNNTLW